MYLTSPPRLLRFFMPCNLIWRIPEKEKTIYLTFDDGPVAGVTEEALAILDKFNAKATFFCVGDNVRRFPATFSKILEANHAVGNHTFHHLNGWQTLDDEFLKDVKKCAGLVDSKLFRPPYGRITRSQARIISKDYRIIMWSILSGDFDPSITAEQCAKNVIKSARPGDIVVMHDSKKSAKNMLTALPHILEYFTLNEFSFKTIAH